jgi:hypothetical protein
MHLQSPQARLDCHGHEAELKAGFLAGEVSHPSQPNLSAAWQICGKFLAVAFFTEPRGHIAVTGLPQGKIAQSALPPVCRKTRRRS